MKYAQDSYKFSSASRVKTSFKWKPGAGWATGLPCVRADLPGLWLHSVQPSGQSAWGAHQQDLASALLKPDSITWLIWRGDGKTEHKCKNMHPLSISLIRYIWWVKILNLPLAGLQEVDITSLTHSRAATQIHVKDQEAAFWNPCAPSPHLPSFSWPC